MSVLLQRYCWDDKVPQIKIHNFYDKIYYIFFNFMFSWHRENGNPDILEN